MVAGLEPLEFVNLFPVWHHRADVAAIQRKVRAVAAVLDGSAGREWVPPSNFTRG